MKEKRLKRVIAFLAVIVFITSGFSEATDLDILRKALEKALGERTNYGARRVAALERAMPRGEDTLFITIHANRQLTSAGIRHGALDDVTTVLRVAKSWGWSEKVARVIILENLTYKGEDYSRPLLSCSIRGPKIAEVEWGLLAPKDVVKHLEHAQFYEVGK